MMHGSNMISLYLGFWQNWLKYLSINFSLKTVFLKNLFLFIVSSTLYAGDNNPIAIYLSLEDDPTSMMTIRWITDKTSESDAINFQKIGDHTWTQANGSHIPMPDDHPYFIHYVKIKNLAPDTLYSFHIDGMTLTNRNIAEKIYKFKTMPQKANRPIRFVVGGDMLHDDIQALEETNSNAASKNPDFVLLGGDLAYSVPRFSFFREDFNQWMDWLKAWNKMVTSDGLIIPMATAIGNHEVFGRYGQKPEQAKFFYSLFRTPNTHGFYALDFSDYLSILILDSGHTNSVDGEQQLWLHETLQNRKNIKNKFAVYHVPAYPSVRNSHQKHCHSVKTNWVPIFETYRLHAAFENHDHAYKRTYPLFQDKIDLEKGILYLGDGAWGIRNPRKANLLNQPWYLAQTKSIRHFILVTLLENGRIYEAIGPDGAVFDKTEN